jgi:hypothetical protein
VVADLVAVGSDAVGSGAPGPGAAGSRSPGGTEGVRPRGVRVGARLWLWSTVAVTAGAIGVAITLAPPAAAPVGQGLAYLLFAGSSAHVASTAWFYLVPQVRGHMRQHRGRYVGGPLALIAGVGATAAILPPAVFEWLLLPYFGWQFFHYQKQNLGLASLAASAYRVAGLRPAERRALLAAGIAGIAGLLAHPRLLQVPLRTGMTWAYPVAAAAFAVSAAAGLACLARRRASERPTGFCAVYLSSLAFSLPVFLFGSPYAAVAGMTIAHGLQYLLLVGLVAAGKHPGVAAAQGLGRPGGRGSGRLVQLALLVNVALAGGAILAVASGLSTAQPLGRLLYGGFLGVVMAHFVVDAGLWRLRDRFPRGFLAERVPYLVPGTRAAP